LEDELISMPVDGEIRRFYPSINTSRFRAGFFPLKLREKITNRFFWHAIMMCMETPVTWTRIQPNHCNDDKPYPSFYSGIIHYHWSLGSDQPALKKESRNTGKSKEYWH
jgi:hypothetical protein